MKPILKPILLTLALILHCTLAQAAEPLRIVLFGDSLFAGPYIPDDEKIHVALKKQLQAYGLEAEVVNAGVSGETTAGGLRRVAQVLAAKPTLVVLGLGANDMLRSMDVAAAQDNLSKIIHQLMSGKTYVLLAGMKAKPDRPLAYRQSFDAIYPALAAHYKITLMPFVLQDVAQVPEFNLQDGLHPNGRGAAKMAENLTPYIFKALGYYDKK